MRRDHISRRGWRRTITDRVHRTSRKRIEHGGVFGHHSTAAREFQDSNVPRGARDTACEVGGSSERRGGVTGRVAARYRLGVKRVPALNGRDTVRPARLGWFTRDPRHLLGTCCAEAPSPLSGRTAVQGRGAVHPACGEGVHIFIGGVHAPNVSTLMLLARWCGGGSTGPVKVFLVLMAVHAGPEVSREGG